MIKTPLSTVIGGAGIWTPGCTVIGSMQKTLDRLIKSLFANNEQGFADDPNDLTTMFQDAAGTIPVTGSGQPVGLVLDKSKGLVLGSELIPQPLDLTKSMWVTIGTISEVTSNSFTNTSGAGAGKQYQIVSGKRYSISITYSKTESTTVLGVYDGSAGAIVTSTASSGTLKANALLSTSNLYIRISGNATVTINSISVKEILGNHAYQSTSSMRPLLLNSPRKIDYDAVDDKLITNLPAQLTGCTVVRAVPNVGTQILTNQTIPTPYNDNTDHCGLIVINRALTATETAQITQLFNKAAGV